MLTDAEVQNFKGGQIETQELRELGKPESGIRRLLGQINTIEIGSGQLRCTFSWLSAWADEHWVQRPLMTEWKRNFEWFPKVENADGVVTLANHHEKIVLTPPNHHSLKNVSEIKDFQITGPTI